MGLEFLTTQWDSKWYQFRTLTLQEAVGYHQRTVGRYGANRW